MPRVNESISMYSGESRIIKLSIVDQDNGGIPLDLTNYNLTFLAHLNGVTKILKTESNGITILNPQTGQLEIRLSSADTRELSGTLLFEVKVTDINNEEVIVTLGRMTITKVYSTEN